uniref:Uncharacterized protein n=1 Tax=Caenorhabditis japonica TaxID=281687 RepID=A0A8R1IIZ4_CAEJA
MTIHRVHQTAASSYQLLFSAFCNLKSLAEKYPDKIFISVIQSSVKVACEKLCHVGEQCHPENQFPTEHILNHVFTLIEMDDIPSTWKLKQITKTAEWKDYTNIEEPREFPYCKSEMTIEEIV